MKNLRTPEKINVQSEKPESSNSAIFYDVVVFCDPDWKTVFQRPLISLGINKDLNILYIEKPVITINENNMQLLEINPCLHVLRPYVNSIEDIFKVLPRNMRNKKIPLGWFCSAAFSPLLELIRFNTVVYDCIPKSSFTANIMPQERRLLAHADVIFTGNTTTSQPPKMMPDNLAELPEPIRAYAS